MKKRLHTKFITFLTAAAFMPFAAGAQGAFGVAEEFYVGVDTGTVKYRNLCDDAREGFGTAATALHAAATGGTGPVQITSVAFGELRTCDDNSGFLRLLAGVRLNEYITMEFGGSIHEDFQVTGTLIGNDAVPIDTNLKVGFHTFDLSILGTYPLTETVSIYGRVGAMAWESEVTHSVSGPTQAQLQPVVNAARTAINAQVPNFAASEDDTDFLYGIGANAQLIDDLYLDMWWSRIDGDVEVDALGLGVSYRF